MKTTPTSIEDIAVGDRVLIDDVRWTVTHAGHNAENPEMVYIYSGDNLLRFDRIGTEILRVEAPTLEEWIEHMNTAVDLLCDAVEEVEPGRPDEEINTWLHRVHKAAQLVASYAVEAAVELASASPQMCDCPMCSAAGVDVQDLH
jgi:hypothetical protein